MKTIYVDGFTLKRLPGGKQYVKILTEKDENAIPVEVPDDFVSKSYKGEEYMLCLDKQGNIL